MKKILTVGAACALFTVCGMAPASAGTNGPLTQTDGSSVKFIANGDTFRICDLDTDGDSVYVKFHYAGSGGDIRLNWTGGGNTCTDRSYNIGEGKTVYYQSCEDDAFRDTCSTPVTGIA